MRKERERSRGGRREASTWDRDKNEQKLLTDINQACQSPAWLSSLQGTDPDGPIGCSAPAGGDLGPVPTYIDVVGVDVIRVGIAQQRMELHAVAVVWKARGEGGIRRWQGQRVTCPPSVSNRAPGSASEGGTKLQRAARRRGKAAGLLKDLVGPHPRSNVQGASCNPCVTPNHLHSRTRSTPGRTRTILWVLPLFKHPKTSPFQLLPVPALLFALVLIQRELPELKPC